MITKVFLTIIVIFYLLILPATYLKAQSKINSDSLAAAKHIYAPLRYDEDWSYLKDTSLRTEGLDELKFISLNKSKASYLTIGGESRLRFEYYRNENLRDQPYQNNGYFQQRSFLHADLHLANFFRVFTQFNSSTTSFRQRGPRPIFDRDDIDINQAFFDLYLKNKNYTLRVGRQEMLYGNGKLVEPREGPNQRLAFNAIRFIANVMSTKIETFISRPV
jgi:hypothetical protein